MMQAARYSEGKARDKTFRCFAVRVAMLLFLLAGCAPLTPNQGQGVGEGEKEYQAAETAFQEGRYGTARELYRTLAENRSEPQRAEHAQFNAAFLLLYYKNPDSDYRRAEQEFEEFMVRYPAGVMADEAGTWLSVLSSIEQLKQDESPDGAYGFPNTTSDFVNELRKANAANEKAAEDMHRLVIEQNELNQKIGELENERDVLLKEKAALVKERDGLEKERLSLEKKTELLTKDKEALIRDKAQLKKNIRDLTLVDVKMEKKRNTVK